MKQTAELPPVYLDSAVQSPVPPSQEVVNHQFGQMTHELQPETPPATIPEQTPQPRRGLLGRVKDLAQKVQYYAYTAAAKATGTLRGGPDGISIEAYLPKFVTDTSTKLQDVSESILAREQALKPQAETQQRKNIVRRALLGAGAVAVGAAAALLKGNMAVAAAAVPSANRLIGNDFVPDIDVDTGGATDISEQSLPAPDMTLAAHYSDPAEYTEPSSGEYTLAAGVANGNAETLPPEPPNLTEQFAEQLGLEKTDDGFLTPGLDKFPENGQAQEGNLFPDGTGYHTLEEIARAAGLTTEQIQELDRTGEWHNLVREMLHESDVTYAAEAHDYPDMRLDTELHEGFQFKINADLLQQLHDLLPQQTPVAELLEGMGLSADQIQALDEMVASWDQEALDRLYEGTSVVDPPSADQVHGLDDLLPDSLTLEEKQELLENLWPSILEHADDTAPDPNTDPATPPSAAPEENGDGLNPAPWLVGGAGLLTTVGVGAWGLHHRRRRRDAEDAQRDTEARRQAAEAARQELARRQEWLDHNTPIDFTRYNNHPADTYREDIRNAAMNTAQQEGIASRQEFRHAIRDWVEFTLGSHVAERADRLRALYEGLTDAAGRPIIGRATRSIDNFNDRLVVPVVAYGNNATRIDPVFAERLQNFITESQENFAEYAAAHPGMNYNAGFWSQIGEDIPLSSMLITARSRLVQAQRA